MSTIRTNLGDYATEAHLVRVQVTTGIQHTDVQSALEEIATTQAVVETPVSSSPYNVLQDDGFLAVDSSGGAITINLALAAARSGRQLVIKDVGGAASTNNITIVPNGAETIDGLAQFVLNVDFGGVRLSPKDGNGYRVSP